MQVMTGRPQVDFMYKSLSVLLISSVVLAGCGQSRLNPLNWFGSAEPVAAVPSKADENPLIPKKSALARDDSYQGVLVAEIKSMKIERVPGGAILRVAAVDRYQGSWDVRLQPQNDGFPVDGTLSYELRALPGSVTGGTERTRLINAAVFVSDQDLTQVRSLQVIGEQNSLISRR
jgi:ABC-type uncharacterized transport system auxiliary subunit